MNVGEVKQSFCRKTRHNRCSMQSIHDLNLEIPRLNRVFRCGGCGECCTQMFGRKFGVAILPGEKILLEQLAQKRGRSAHFLPLSKDAVGNITTWQFADTRCPFFTGVTSDVYGKHCLIYNARPLVCRAYPLMPYGVGECTELQHATKLFHIEYSPEQVSAATLYMMKVAAKIKAAAYIYDINRGKWRLNR